MNHARRAYLRATDGTFYLIAWHIMQGVMKFTKYLCASAGGSRWDVVGEFEVGAAVEEDEEE